MRSKFHIVKCTLTAAELVKTTQTLCRPFIACVKCLGLKNLASLNDPLSFILARITALRAVQDDGYCHRRRGVICLFVCLSVETCKMARLIEMPFRGRLV